MQDKKSFTLGELKSQPRKVIAAATTHGSVRVVRDDGKSAFRVIVLKPLPEPSI